MHLHRFTHKSASAQKLSLGKMTNMHRWKHTKICIAPYKNYSKTDKQEQKQTSKQTRTKSLFIILGSNSWWLGAPKNWVSWGENINVNHKNHKMLINRKHGYWPQKITYKPLWLLAETHYYLSYYTVCPLRTGVKDILTNITILS